LEAVGEHPVPAGPLAVRWLGYELEPPQAGALTRARVALENAGTASWRDLNLSYHWLDGRGNPIVWDGLRYGVSAAPGEHVERELDLRGPIPPGEYRLAFDLVDDKRFWLAELGNFTPEIDIEVAPRDAAAARAFLPAQADLDPDGEERVYAAHLEGYAAVGGSVEWITTRLQRTPKELEPYAPGGGRNPAFAHPLILPSLLPPLEPNTEVAGLPAWLPEGDEPWVYDARVKLRLRSGRRRG
jgi:hypothetical protein